MNGYDLSRNWFDYAFEHSRTVRPIHTAIYFWCIEKANRAGWVTELQLPTDEACRALGIKDPKSFRAALDELISWGAIRLVQEAKSQNIARYISLYGDPLTNNGCLDKALITGNRLAEKRSGEPPSEPLSDTPGDTPGGTLTSPPNIKPKTLNLKPQTTGAKPPPVAAGGDKVLAVKKTYREKVQLTEDQMAALVAKHGQPLTDRLLDKLSLHKLANGQTYKSDYHAILNWVVKAVAEDDA